MRIAVGSENPVKIAAVKEAFEKVWPNKSFEVIGAKVLSGVSDQPMNLSHTIKGSTRRAKLAIKKVNADFGVGLEGGLEKIGKEWFDAGWIVVIDKKGTIGMGGSIRMHTPKSMMTLIKRGIELGVVNDIVFKKKNSKMGDGHFGNMTNNAITRKDGYRDGVISALARFIHPEIYKD